MGRLIGLELHNFKSYRGTASIGFGSASFTSIIGPNGSGKSNMMDAISFVLGIRSNHLRSANLKDLIYRGRIMDSDNLNNEEYEGNDEDEPNSAYVMAIYEKTNGEILKLKRTIGSTGSSDYNINGKSVTATQYSNILKHENILIKARNFLVFQGDVEKIASQSSSELTKLIETISGSIELKQDYDTLLDSKETAHDETALKNSKKRTLRDELNQYRNQCVEVELFDSKFKEMTNLIQAKYLTRLNLQEDELQSNTTSLEESKTTLKKLNKEINKLESHLLKFKKQQSLKDQECKKLEALINSSNSTIKSKQLNLIPITSEIPQIVKKISNYENRIETIKNDQEEQSSIVVKTTKQLSKIQSSFDNYLAEFEKTQSESVDPNALIDYKKLRENFLMKGGHIESKLLELKEERQSILTDIENSNKRRDFILSRIAELNLNRNENSNNLKDLEFQSNDITSSIKNNKQILNQLKTTREKIMKEEFSINSKLKQVLIEINELNAIHRESKREKQLRSNCSTLKRLFPGVKGLLYDLCKPKQKKYELAVSTVLGKNFDSIVVDTIDTANHCIEYLKEQRLGVASFIPMDTVEAKPPNPNLRSVNDKTRPTLDIVDYDSEFEKAIQYACGNSIICDNIQVAKHVKWDRKIDVKAVTLDGSLIHKSGLMTGGLTSNTGRRWDKSELQRLNNEKDELKLESQTINAKIPSELLDKKLEDEITHLENRLPALRDSKNDLKRLIDDIDTEIKNQKRLLNEIDQQINELNEKADDSEQLEYAENELKTIQQTIYSEFCSNYGFNSISEFEDTIGFKSREHAKEKTRFLKQIQHLENKLSFENERLEEYDKRLIKINNDKKKFEKNLKELTKQKKQLEHEIDELESEAEVYKEEFDSLNAELKKTLQENNIQESNMHDLRMEINDINRKITGYEESIEKCKMDKLNILKACKLENIKLPMVFGSLDNVAMDDADQDEQDQDDLDMELEIDYSSLKESYRSMQTIDEIENFFNEKVDKLTTEISNLNPNVKARDRLNDAKSRLEDIDSEFSDARSEEKRIDSEYQEIKKKRYHLFMEAFNHISSKIDSIYKELTKSTVSPLGGSAYLTLEDEDEPYLSGIKYHAMPPMKRFRDMELLSGGEKTIAALALLFAIHSFHPSPFFVLDEVDAALDNANVNKIANYISKNSGPDFQFIVISLKNGLFERSDALVGIYREQMLNSSKTLTLDLRGYPDEEVV